MKRKVLIIIGVSLLICIMIPFIINLYIKNSVRKQIISLSDISNIGDVDAVIVLGCRAYSYGPSMMLQARLDRGIEVYNKIGDTKLLLSGDHGNFEYDEVNTMRDYVLESSLIDSENVFMDHAGFSTYDSIYRAKEIFLANKIIIVTQDYHLYRALYIARELGLESYGVSADKIESGQFSRDIREFLARNKDFLKVKFKPSSKYLGDKIPISGNGNLTLD